MMNKSTRNFRTWTICALLAVAVFPATAQTKYPEKAVKIVVPFAPGGSSDSATRILAEQLGAMWKQPVIVENKPGATATIGAAQVANSAADGYTILLAPVSIATVKLFVKNPGFDPVKDLLPVTQIARGDYVLSVHKDLPVNTMGELAAYAHKNPGKVFDATFGGSSMLAFQQFAEVMNFERQNVLYRGEALAISALIGGEVQAAFSTLTAAKPFIDSGRIKAIGIPSKTRSPIAPNIKTSDESGAKGFYADFWFGLMVPKGTPEDVRKKIEIDVAEALARKDVKDRLYAIGLTAKSSTADEFGKLIQYEATRWVDTAKRSGLEPQ